MILVTSGSHSTRSASEPTAIRPLRGNRLKIFAAFVLVTATNWFSSILPVTLGKTGQAVGPGQGRLGNGSKALDRRKLTTHLSQIRDILSSAPLVPSGIRVKSSLPTARWEVWKVQWPLPVTCKSPLAKTDGQTCQTGVEPSLLPAEATTVSTMTAGT